MPQRSLWAWSRPQPGTLVPEGIKVLLVHKDHPAAVLNAAVAVIFAVDGGVVLVVRSQGLQQQPTLRHSRVFQLVAGKVRQSGFRGERPRISRAVREDETAGPFDLGFKVLEAGYYGGDVGSNQAVVPG